MPFTLLFVFGTRPEAIKLCAVVNHLRRNPLFRVRVCVTAQHRALLDQVLEVFGVKPDHDLDVMLPGQSLFQSTSRILSALEGVLQTEMPDCVVVQGDTTTTFCGALAAFYQRVPVAHVEAGLRTGDLAQPFPEEANRVLTGRLAALHFPPTQQSAENLAREGVTPERITVTGNTGIDALLQIKERLEAGELQPPKWPWDVTGKKLILVTGHRRESFGDGFENICRALAKLAERPDTLIVYPVHPNPNVTNPVQRWLANRERVHLIEPQQYVPFIDLMRQAHFILSDSGGVQEEAPSLGKPVLVMREKTERPEAVDAGTSRLVGTDPERILAESAILLDNDADYQARCRIHNPYGDGHASERIEAALLKQFSPGAAD